MRGRSGHGPAPPVGAIPRTPARSTTAVLRIAPVPLRSPFFKPLSRAGYVGDVVAEFDQLALRQPVLVGRPLGGSTAMLTAAAHPELIRAPVLVEAGPGRTPRDRPETLLRVLEDFLEDEAGS